MDRRIVVSGNCQIGALAATLSAVLPDDRVTPVAYVPGDEGSEAANREAVADADVWVTNISRRLHEQVIGDGPRPGTVLYVPDVRFFGFHPDIVHIGLAGGGILQTGAAGPYHSAIVATGWRLGLSEDEIVARFDRETCTALGYPDFWSTALVELRRRVDLSDLDWSEVYLPLARRRRVFMLTDNHPRVDVMIHLARLVGERLGADRDLMATDWETVVPDGLLATSEVWPVYPAVADRLGLPGGFAWRTGDGEVLGLQTFVRRCLETYALITPDDMVAPELDDPRLAAVIAGDRTSAVPVPDGDRGGIDAAGTTGTETGGAGATGPDDGGTGETADRWTWSADDERRHPYQGLPDTRFWNRAVAWAPPAGVDPVVSFPYRLSPEHRVATMGSCFAQHLARHLQRSGLTYHVTEPAPPDMSDDDAGVRQYGLFSARYGNVYTVAQALQTFRRAFGEWEPSEAPWRRPDGRLVDPFRPTVEPDGFADLDALEADRRTHLAATRRVFTEADVLVFTLGLTEGWRSRADGAVLAAAPGSAGTPTGGATYEFVNFGIDEVRADLIELCRRARDVNPGIRVLLTVSPVPLVATFEDRHVLVSTVASKSVLRTAADEATRALDHVHYFPSYEIIASATADRDYFGPDRREVDEQGVAHVMRTFTRHVIAGGDTDGSTLLPAAAATQSTDVICDEEVIVGALEASR